MNQSEIEICNVALARLGASAIRDFEENNKQARICKALYSHCKNYLLNMYNWTFARELIKLEKLTGDSILGNIYQLPADCLTPISVHPNNRFTKWEIIGNTIHSNLGLITLKYTKEINDTTKFSQSFVYALAELLAAKLSASIIQDKEIGSQLIADATISINMAIEEDANLGDEQRILTENLELDSFIQQEYGYGYGRDGYYGDNSPY